MSETQLQSTVSVTAQDGPQYGVYPLGPLQVEQLELAVTTEMDPVPASEATDVTTLDYPGVSIRARSVPELSADGSAQPRRIPTVFAPFHAGVKFALGARQAPPGVTLHISNVTLLLPNVTYSGVFESGFMDFFEMGRFARMCFTDSILALKSCKGFTPDTHHMWCCTARHCNILYTQVALEDLGYDLFGALEHIGCVAKEEDGGGGGASVLSPVVTGSIPVPDAEVEASRAGAGARRGAYTWLVLLAFGMTAWASLAIG